MPDNTFPVGARVTVKHDALYAITSAGTIGIVLETQESRIHVQVTAWSPDKSIPHPPGPSDRFWLDAKDLELWDDGSQVRTPPAARRVVKLKRVHYEVH